MMMMMMMMKEITNRTRLRIGICDFPKPPTEGGSSVNEV
jgi:hypothetical protein